MEYWTLVGGVADKNLQPTDFTQHHNGVFHYIALTQGKIKIQNDL